MPGILAEGTLRALCVLVPFRSFRLAFLLLLSFARDALVHLNAIVCSVAVVNERPGSPCARRPSKAAREIPGVAQRQLRAIHSRTIVATGTNNWSLRGVCSASAIYFNCGRPWSPWRYCRDCLMSA